MTSPATLVVLGDKHVGPFLSVWSAAPAAAATRTVPQSCETLDHAVTWATGRLEARDPATGWPWIRRADGRVLSPAYLRAYRLTRPF